MKMLTANGVICDNSLKSVANKITRWESDMRYTTATVPAMVEISTVYNIVKTYCDSVVGYDIMTLI